jgi:hypothetical protein
MGTTTIRRAVCLVVAMGCALLLGGCGGTTTPAPTTPAATAPNTSPPVLPPTPAPSATASGPMTGDELVWLEAICECHTGWSGTGWSGWSWSCRSVRDSRSNWPASAVSFG